MPLFNVMYLKRILSHTMVTLLAYLAHGLKKLLHKCNILCEQLWHTAKQQNRKSRMSENVFH